MTPIVRPAATSVVEPDRVLALLQMQREMLVKAASGAETRDVLELLVELIEAYAPDAIASVLLVERDTQTLRTLVSSRLPTDYCDAIDGLSAANLNETVVVEDIATDPLWAPFRELALAHGLHACWSTPIRDPANEVIGIFALYYDSARRPTAADLELVDVAAGIASIVFERERAIASATREATERDEIDQRYRTLVEQLPLVIYADALDAVSSNIFTSRQIEDILGYSVSEWQADEMLFVKLLHPDDRDRVLAAHARTHRTHEPLSVEYRLRASDGRWVWIRDEGVIVTDEEGQPLHLQGYLLDISTERQAEEQLRRQALYDPLTGLANRAQFTERLDHAVATRKRSGRQTALLFVDLNNFKSINDRFGHHAGDAALQALAEQLESVIRTGDTAARLGGDEFGVILQSVNDPGEASSVAHRLHKALAEPLEIEGRQLRVEASIGIALGDDPRVLLKEADAAMYRAKSHPGLGFAFFDPSLDEAALVRFRRVSELADAVERDEFTLHYQPIVTLASGATDGYEALIRWRHPELGELQPLDFIPLAEQGGQIVAIGRWVLQEACAHIARLGRTTGRVFEIAVNVSARQLQHPDFVSHVDDALRESGIAPEQLVLEITESVVIDTGDVEERLAQLKQRGVQIALDDFGTGYGSLAYLQKLPVDIVKIDRSFTATIDTDDDGEALLRAIIGLGSALGTRLIAEGIERATQSDLIRTLGCERGQGFHYGRPSAMRSVEPAQAVSSGR
jgi:diguanylate cyclase (GGDEF)-like protein/PAS domain S-box-containing protein